MSKIIRLFLIIVILLSFTACTTSTELPEDIKIIDESELPPEDKGFVVFGENLTYDDQYDVLIENTSYIVRLKVEKKEYFSFNVDERAPNSWQVGISYKINVSEVLYGSGFSKKNNLILYDDYWPNKAYTIEKQIGLIEGKEYIVYLREMDELAPESIKNYIDYLITSSKLGIIIYEGKNTFLVNTLVAGKLGAEYSNTNVDGNLWGKVESKSFEKALIDSIKSD